RRGSARMYMPGAPCFPGTPSSKWCSSNDIGVDNGAGLALRPGHDYHRAVQNLTPKRCSEQTRRKSGTQSFGASTRCVMPAEPPANRRDSRGGFFVFSGRPLLIGLSNSSRKEGGGMRIGWSPGPSESEVVRSRDRRLDGSDARRSGDQRRSRMMWKSSRLVGSLMVGGLVFVAGCDDATTTEAGELAPTGLQLDIVSGNEQRAAAGSELPNPVVIRVRDSAGRAVRNQIVNFRVTDGGGSVYGGATLTNESGIAQDRWRL